MATKKILIDLDVAGSTEATSFIKTGGTSSQFLKADGSVDSTAYAGAYTHPTYSTTNINTSGSTIIDSITTNSTGHITAMGTRTLTLANLGYTGASDANKYIHPTHPGDDMSIDTGALSGAVVVSDIDLNVTTDTLGHVTDANATVATRTLTLANLGYTGSTTANNYVHPTYVGDDMSIDTGALSGAVVISDIDLNVTTDTLGHVTDANATVATRTLTLGNLGYTGATDANKYVHPGYATTNINTSGAVIVDSITTNSTGHITAMGTRTLTLADLGYAADGEGVSTINPSAVDGKEGIEVLNGSTATATVGLDLDLIDAGFISHVAGVGTDGKNYKNEKSQFFAYHEQFFGGFIGNGSTTTFTNTHDLGFHYIVQIKDNESTSPTYREEVYPKVVRTSGTVITITFNTAPDNGHSYSIYMTKINQRNI